MRAAESGRFERVEKALGLIKRKMQYLHKRLPVLHGLDPSPKFELDEDILKAREEEEAESLRQKAIHGYVVEDIVFDPPSTDSE